jgi:hypothetical protein
VTWDIVAARSARLAFGRETRREEERRRTAAGRSCNAMRVLSKGKEEEREAGGPGEQRVKGGAKKGGEAS